MYFPTCSVEMVKNTKCSMFLIIISNVMCQMTYQNENDPAGEAAHLLNHSLTPNVCTHIQRFSWFYCQQKTNIYSVNLNGTIFFAREHFLTFSSLKRNIGLLVNQCKDSTAVYRVKYKIKIKRFTFSMDFHSIKKVFRVLSKLFRRENKIFSTNLLRERNRIVFRSF